MGIALPAAQAGTAARGRAAGRWIGGHPGLFVLCGYLAAAVALDWRLWAQFGTATPVGDPGPADYDLMAWFVRYAAGAVAHGHLPALVTPALNAPRGINLMWNNTVLFPGVALTPVTLLAGPNASLTVLTTLGYAGSAAAMYWLLRRYAAGPAAAALGGLVFGFSPGMVDAADSHYGMQFAVLAPLMVEAVASIATGRGRALTAGIRLGLLATAQLFTGEELLSDTAIVCLLLVVVLAVSRPSAALARLGRTALGLGAAVAVAVPLSGYALWVQFRGPLTEHGDPWNIASDGNGFGAFVNPQAGLLFHTASSAAYAAYRADSAEYAAYLGPPLLVLVAGLTLWYWRDPRVRAAGLVWLVMEALSVGVNSWWLPFHWLQGLPLLRDMLPMRMSLLADGGAAAVLAFGLDLAATGRLATGDPATRSRRAGWWRRAAVAVVALLAVLPLLPRPVPAITGAPVPAGWNAVFARLRLPPDASVLVVPLPNSEQGEAMLWQADTGQPAELDAGWFLGPNASGQAAPEYWGPFATVRTMECLNGLWQGTATLSGVDHGTCATYLWSALAYWNTTAVVADTVPGTPLAQFLTAQLGPPAAGAGHLLAWRARLPVPAHGNQRTVRDDLLVSSERAVVSRARRARPGFRRPAGARTGHGPAAPAGRWSGCPRRPGRSGHRQRGPDGERPRRGRLVRFPVSAEPGRPSSRP